MFRIPTARTLALLSLLPIASLGAQSMSPATLIRHVRVFDGSKLLSARDILLQNGRISAIGTTVQAPPGAIVVDGTNRTLLPGLIDSHTHSYGDALADALPFGVTTELDMFADPGEARARRAEQRAGLVSTRADLLSAGVLVTVAKGHGTEYGIPIPTIAAPESAQAFVDARIAEGSDYIKIILDDGSAYGIKLPTVSQATLVAVVKAAHARKKLAVVHVGTLADGRMAIDAGADGLMHLFVDRAPDAQFGKFVAAHHAFVVPTLTVLRSIAGTAAGSDLAADARLAPYLGAAGRGTLLSSFPFKSTVSYAAAEESVKQLKAAGATILAGTDAPNPGTAHGISMHRELELLVHAGLTPTEALIAATSAPARAFSLPDRGTIAVGQRADLFLVEGDPTQDITATRAIVWVWKGGVAFDRAKLATSIASQRVTGDAPVLGLVSNFDDGTQKSSFGMGWVISTDRMAGGTSSATMTVADGGASSTAKSLDVTGDISPGLPYAWGGVMFMPSKRPMGATDLSKAQAIRFWAKGDGRTYKVMVFAESKGRAPLTTDFVAGSEWKEFVFPISSFGGIDGHDIQGIAFTAGPAAGAFRFKLDEVRVQ
jgi:imidazolonepropionase-like amidohydrolase